MNNTLHIGILALLALVLFTLVDPFMYWMPSMVQMIALTLVAGLLVAYVGLIVREEAGDERETMHRMHAGRAGFLAGIGILTAGLLYQGLLHVIDPWIPLALATMVISKMLARWYVERAN